MTAIATLRRNMIFGAAAVGAGALLAVCGLRDDDEPDENSVPDLEDAYFS